MPIQNNASLSFKPNVESSLIGEQNTKVNNGPVTTNSECLKSGNLSLFKQYSNITRLVQQNTDTSINWQDKNIIFNKAIAGLKETQTFNSEMKNVVLKHIENPISDAKIDTLEKGLAFLETERKLSDLVNKQQMTLEAAKDMLTKCLNLGSQEDFNLDKLNEFNTFLENPQDKDIGEKLDELFNSSEVPNEVASLQSSKEETKDVTQLPPSQNKEAKAIFTQLSNYDWGDNKKAISETINNLINENGRTINNKLLSNVQKGLEKKFNIKSKDFNKVWGEIVSKNSGGEKIDNGPVTLKFGEKEVKMKMTFTPQVKLSGFPGDTTDMKHCSSIYQSATVDATKHAVNLWRQDITLPVAEEQQKPQSMSFLRHGYVLKQETAAKEILANACVLQHGEEAILNTTKEKPLSLNFSNIQLMTLGKCADLNKPLEQMEMFNSLTSNEKQPLELKYEGRTLYVTFEKPLLFNFGVNVQHFRPNIMSAIRFIANLAGSNNKDIDLSTSKKKIEQQNLESFKQLFGEKFPNIINFDEGSLIQKKLDTLSDGDSKKEQIQTLANQILDIYKSHPEGFEENPYALPTRVLALTNLLGYAGSFNCKSGKDRTGVCAMELSNLCAQMMSGEKISNPMTPISDEEQKNLQAIYKEGSCARDIPHINTVFQENLKIDQNLKFVANEKRFGVDLSKSFESNISKLNSQT